jgi:hypothetical protein
MRPAPIAEKPSPLNREMASPVVVNGDVSLVLVDTKALTAAQSAVVLLSSVRDPGRSVTIRDSLGYLSSPQTILLSTTTGVLFADGTSSTQIYNPFGYITVTSRDPTSWNITNSFGFPAYETIANTLALTTSSLLTNTLTAAVNLSTPYVNLRSLDATSTSAILGPTFVSSLIVGPPPAIAQPNLAEPGYSAYIQGNTKLYSDLLADGAARFQGSISTGGNFFAAGPISTAGSIGVLGDIVTLGNILAPSGSIVANNLQVNSNATFGGSIAFSNTLYVGSSISVQNQISTTAVTASSINALSSINFQEKFITYRGTAGLASSDPISLPGISTNNLQASNSIQTSNLTVFQTIQAQTATTFSMNGVAFVNPGGSLVVSSIQANAGTFSNSLAAAQLQTSSLVASTIQLTGNLTATGSGVMNIGALVTSSISTVFVAADQIEANQFTTTSLTLSQLQVSNSLVLNNLSTFSASNAIIQNTGGSLSTNTVLVRNAFAASSVTVTSGQINSPSGLLTITAPSVAFSAANISSLTASTLTASTITTSRLTIGGTPGQFQYGPYFTVDNTYPSTNVTITGGPGDYLTPFFLSNSPPPGIGPTDPYTVQASFRLNWNGPALPSFTAQVTGLSLFPNGQAASVVSIYTQNSNVNPANLYGLTPTNQTVSFAVDNPITSNFTSLILLNGTMIGNSAFSLQFRANSNANPSMLDANNAIVFNNGLIRWPYSLNATTIQNSLNDMAVRNLNYYGSLSFASDPALKEDVRDADTAICFSTIAALPLRRYKFKDAYLSQFQQRDAHRLGFLATDLEPHFPKSITMTDLEVPGLVSSIRMIDTQQIEMAHIGATKYLATRVESLNSTLASHRSELSTLKNLLNIQNVVEQE